MNQIVHDINQTDQTLHSLAQLLALTAMQWLPARPDDSHTNLIWNSHKNRLEGQPFTCKGQQIRLIIDMDAFALNFIDDRDNVLASFSPANRTPAHAMAWWKSQMQAWGIAEIRGLNYQLANDSVPAETVYEHPSGLADWAYWRTMANETLHTLTAWSGRNSEVRVWPHHFDTGVYYSLIDDSGQERAAIWAGYAIADSVCAEPYYYLSGYSRSQVVDMGQAPALKMGEWRNGPDWKGALLPVSSINNPAVVDDFFRESYRWVNSVVN